MFNNNKMVVLSVEKHFHHKRLKETIDCSRVRDCRMIDRAGSFDSGIFLEIAKNDMAEKRG